ncbi:MAG: DUF2063 domain-containing protein [Geminicoccaceae bacterium]
MLRDLQQAFKRGVYEGDAHVLDGVIRSDGVAPDERLAIYRNNTFASLIGVLEAAFPVVERLVGERFFRATARRFIEQTPPREAQLARYGGAFPAFLAQFAPAKHLGYLADVARLEWARNEAYFAADAPTLEVRLVEGLAPEALMALTLDLHASARLLSSAFAIDAIWQANQPVHERVPRVDVDRPEAVLVLRPAFCVEQMLLQPGEHALLEALQAGRPLGDAASVALARQDALDLQGVLARHFLAGTFAAFDQLQGEELRWQPT